MKRFFAATTIVVGALWCGTQAQAGNITVTNYNLPDNVAFSAATTNGYSYYTGPITITLTDGTTLDAYCADLQHTLHPGEYTYGRLDTDGLGNPISQQQSNRLGQIAALGLFALKNGEWETAAAAQAAIWSLEYNTVSTFTDTGGLIASLFDTILLEVFPNNGRWATALIPYGQGWSENPSASQQMIIGFAAVPEPASMAVLGVGLLGLVAARRRA